MNSFIWKVISNISSETSESCLLPDQNKHSRQGFKLLVAKDKGSRQPEIKSSEKAQGRDTVTTSASSRGVGWRVQGWLCRKSSGWHTAHPDQWWQQESPTAPDSEGTASSRSTGEILHPSVTCGQHLQKNPSRFRRQTSNLGLEKTTLLLSGIPQSLLCSWVSHPHRYHFHNNIPLQSNPNLLPSQCQGCRCQRNLIPSLWR